jgi:phosphate binding protein
MSSAGTDTLLLADLLQISALGRRTCHLRVSDGRTSGDVYLEEGRVVHATFGKLEGEAAVLALLVSGNVYVRVDAAAAPRRRVLNRDVQQLMLEAARREDEAGRNRPPMPSPARSIRRPLAIVAFAALGLAAVAALIAWRYQIGATPALASAPVLAHEATELTGPDDAAPRLLQAARPVRPSVEVALTPTIVCRLLVDRDGHVAERRIWRSRLDLAAFEDAALDAASHFRFAPARKAGAPVAAWVNVPISFAAADARAETIHIKGSDTIGGALGPELGRAWESQRPSVRVQVEALGSATAFQGLLDGSADLGASSRPANAVEIAEARSLGVTLEEHLLGYDGVAVIVNPKNPIDALTVGQIAHLFGDPKALWSTGRPVHAIGRPSYSGTHAFFKERVLGRDFAPSVRTLEKNEDIVAAVAGDPDAVAYVGLGWVQNGVRALAIAPADDKPSVQPSQQAVRDGSYALYRPLLLYTRGAPRGELARFVRFALSAEGQAIVARHGFVPTDVPAEQPAEIDGEPAAAAAAPIRVLFGSAQSSLDAEARRELRGIAGELARGETRAVVIGHADAEGDAERNRRLALARAEHVASYLRVMGAPEAAVTIDAASAEHPVASNTTAEGRRKNRRADVFLLSR